MILWWIIKIFIVLIKLLNYDWIYPGLNDRIFGVFTFLRFLLSAEEFFDRLGTKSLSVINKIQTVISQLWFLKSKIFERWTKLTRFLKIQDRLKKISNNIEHTNEEAVPAFFTFLAELEEAGRTFKPDLYLVS